jgi:hypothetical protein
MSIFESTRPTRAQVRDVRASGEFAPGSEMAL